MNHRSSIVKEQEEEVDHEMDRQMQYLGLEVFQIGLPEKFFVILCRDVLCLKVKM